MSRQEMARLLPRGLAWAIAIVAIARGSIGVASTRLTGSDLENAIGGICTLAGVAIALLLAESFGNREKRRAERMAAVLSPRVRERGYGGGEATVWLMWYVFHNNLVLQTGSPSAVSFFAAYFAASSRPAPVQLSDLRRWGGGFWVSPFRQGGRQLERSLDPSIAADLEVVRDRLRAKSAHLDLYMLRDRWKAARATPRGMVRLTFHPQDYESLPERVESAVDLVLPLLERAWRGSIDRYDSTDA